MHAFYNTKGAATAAETAALAEPDRTPERTFIPQLEPFSFRETVRELEPFSFRETVREKKARQEGHSRAPTQARRKKAADTAKWTWPLGNEENLKKSIGKAKEIRRAGKRAGGQERRRQSGHGHWGMRKTLRKA